MKIWDFNVQLLPVVFRTRVLVKVETGELGLSGRGETTVERKARSVSRMIDQLRDVTIGKNPEVPRKNATSSLAPSST